MARKPITVLGINPGAKYIGTAVFHNADLRDWRMKAISAKWSDGKMKMIQEIIVELVIKHQPGVVALKSLHPSRKSPELGQLTEWIKLFSEKRGIQVYQYSIRDLKEFYSPTERINKRELAERVGIEYPALFHELNRERSHKNKYFIRMFEAVALGAICFHELDSDQ